MALPHADEGLSEDLEQGSHAQDPLLQANETPDHEAVEATQYSMS